MNKIFITLVGFFLFLQTSQAQKTISGSVTDQEGIPLVGAIIQEIGTPNGTTTNSVGEFTLQVNNEAILSISYIGYESQEISTTNQSSIEAVLNLDETSLEEVVVIGYGEVDRDKISSSISTVEGDVLAKTIASNAAEGLQGKAAGVQVLSSGGNPGASPQILIRGITTNNGTAPLIVLDGVPLPNGTSLNFLNPRDIENFQILKDASASAIYGSRASNGVVLITTKRGKVGKSQLSLDISSGVQRMEKIDMANSAEYIEVMNLRRTNDGLAPIYSPDDIGANTDWWEQSIENFAPMSQINARVAGGSDKIKYSGSASYFDQESSYTKGWYERMTGRFNIDFQASDRFSIKQDINPRIENFENTPGSLFNILRIDPLTDVYLPQNERDGRNIHSIYAGSNNLVPNPVGGINRLFNESKFFGILSNTQLNYKITPELSVNTQLGVNLSKLTQDVFNPQFFTTPNQQREINNVTRQINENFDYVWNNTINYTNEFDKHYVNATAGALWDSQNFNYLRGYREDIPGNENPALWYLDAATGEGIRVNGSESVDNILSGIFRTIYSYDDRYYFNGSVRVDESSKFSEGNRTGFFPSASVAWDIDSEAFFNVPWVKNLRLKAGYGQIGNQNISRNGQFFSIGSGNYVFGGERVVTNFLSQFGNPNLQWETLEDKNIGLETTLFSSPLNFSVEYYEKTSEDLLFNVELPNYTGIPGLVAQNIGSFQSEGWDFNTNYTHQFNKDLSLRVNLNASTNRSKAVELAPGNEQLFGQKREDLGNRFIKITELDELVGLFYGFKTDGIFQNQTEINSHSSETGNLLQPNAKPGDLRFVDVNGDGFLNDNDLTSIGNPFPDFYGGITTDLTYKQFDFNMQWYTTQGNDVFNYPSTFLYAGGQDVNVAEGTLSKVWSPTNTGAEFPRLSLEDRNGNYLRPSDLFIEDASYLRLRNAQIGYNLQFKGVENLRVYISGQNLITLTDYSGFDPEVQAGGNIINDFGVDYARNPVSRTYLGGLNLTF